MKKITLILAGIMFLAASIIARAGDSTPISVEQLPAKAQKFLKKYFPKEQVTYVNLEKDVLGVKYEVTCASDTEIEFDSEGNWNEIECGYSTGNVPSEIVPKAINAKTLELYPNAKIVGIDRNKKVIEVQLDTETELTFDAGGKLIEIDVMKHHRHDRI